MTANDVIAVATSIINVLTSGLTQMATGIGSGANAFVEALVYKTTDNTTTASAFILTVALIGSISLAVAFGRRMFSFVISLGGRR